jgi:CheY-like chemotaxis protein
LGLTIAKMLTDLMGGELTVSSQPGQGTTFKVRLFLPEVHATVSAPGTPTRVLPTPSDWGQARCIGYAGPRKQVLVVDNEEADRSLLQRWLAPLGFDVVLATSGQDALRLFGEGLPTGTGMRPHAVFMDLAMPGIDGWETLRRLSAMGLRSGPHAMACAVVSANAFDHWIWPDAAPTQPPALPAAMPTSADRPDAASLHTLLRTVQSGHVRGVQRQLDALARAYPQSGAFVSHARALLQDFRLDELERWVTASTPLDADAGAHRHDHG